jgi:hypothetical protein
MPTARRSCGRAWKRWGSARKASSSFLKKRTKKLLQLLRLQPFGKGGDFVARVDAPISP